MSKFAKLVSVIAVLTLVLTLSASASAENTTDDPAALLAEYNQIMEATEDYISSMFSVERRTQETISIIQANQIISKLGDSDFFGGQYVTVNRMDVFTWGLESQTIVGGKRKSQEILRHPKGSNRV